MVAKLVLSLFLEGADAATAKHLAMHIAAMSPKVISPEELDDDFITDQLAVIDRKSVV